VNNSYDSKQVKDIDSYIMTEVTFPLFDTKGVRKGQLISTISLFNMLDTIPKQTFFINKKGNKISMNPDKSIRISEEKYKIAGRKGKIYISDKDSLHYNTANISAKLYLLLGVEADESTIKSSVYERAFIPLMLTTLFVILVILLAYQNISRFRELIKSQKIIIHSLANTTEWRDKTTGRHLQATKEYVFVLASRMRKNRKFKKTITKDFLNDIVDASPLHDIGKVGIEDSVLLKPGKLNEEEYNIIKNHVYIGKKLLQNDIDQFTTKQTFFEIAKNICAYHHEKYNGNGYIGIKGEKIPLEARIFALCDVYDALRSKRQYKNEFPHEKAVEIILAERGEHFDPDIVDAFMDCQEYFFEISKTNST
jgi:putative two-component system response regulator